MIPAIWDATAAVQERHWWFVARRQILASFLQQRLQAGAAVLDVGCGTGFVLDALRSYFDIAGVEPDESVRARAQPGVCRFIHAGSAVDLHAVAHRRFDAALLLDVLEHIDDDVAALTNVMRSVKPGGFVLLTVPAYPLLWSRHDVDHGHKRRYTRNRLRDMVAAAGAIPTHLTNLNARLFPLALVNRLTGLGASELHLPPTAINRLLTRVFAGEQFHLRRGYPIGLSLLAVVERNASMERPT